MTEQNWQHCAAEVLSRCKLLNPRFSNPNPEQTNAWAYVFSRCGLPCWDFLWIEAVADYFSDPQVDGLPLPGQIIQAAKRVRDRQLTDPRYRPYWEQFRQERRERVDREIESGTHRLQIGKTIKVNHPEKLQTNIEKKGYN